MLRSKVYIMKQLKQYRWYIMASLLLAIGYIGMNRFNSYRISATSFPPSTVTSSKPCVYSTTPPSELNTWKTDLKISGQNICRNSKPYLLILILTIPKHSEKRTVIRDTWTRVNEWPNFKVKITVKHVFLFGKYADVKETNQVLTENNKYGDVVVGNFVDSYRNLTLKVLTGLYWVRRYCPGAKFVAKIDDDIFVNIPLLYNYLEAIPQLKSKILGHLIMNGYPEREGKYSVSHKSYPFNFYPTYTTGAMYIAKPETFFALLDVAQRASLIDMEDVCITGILAKLANLSHLAYSRGMYLPNKPAAPCEFVKNTKLLSKDYSAKDVAETWKLIKEHRSKCLQKK